ncbi:glutamine amidotransferase-like class 1 domain-containing protein 3A, mitochondrial [Rhinatrema bivittatum]|uniref:glutamine amidotransferase-like class 1 domain-containing protein 3A, mitochondrial n=1 Tax=Rhinatrema bivittatum TaxID=194408 RepID=UPI00112D8226|nr:glutamine amidotransferase-like class 1 domain-containing protein 3A, mitochondrial [Rhinatrema bivittatum]
MKARITAGKTSESRRQTELASSSLELQWWKVPLQWTGLLSSRRDTRRKSTKAENFRLLHNATSHAFAPSPSRKCFPSIKVQEASSAEVQTAVNLSQALAPSCVLSRALCSKLSTMGKKVAVILSGCGVSDGSEIIEASSVLVHLSRAGAQAELYAPNIDQMHVVDHLKGQPTNEKRNVLVESARIARGNIKDLACLKVSDLDAAIFPGGFGVVKNLSTWNAEGKDCTVIPAVKDTIKAFHAAKKPIGLCCISPVLAAKIIPGCELTVGFDSECEKWPYAKTADAIKELGCKHVNKHVNEVHVDAKNKLVTTSAFMCNAPAHEVCDGIGNMVKDVLKLAQ